MKTIDRKGKGEERPGGGYRIEEIVAERAVFLCLDGHGDPDGEAFRQASRELFAITRLIRARMEETGRADFRIPRLEFRRLGDPGGGPGGEGKWRLMLRVPDHVTQADLKEARKAAEGNGKPGFSAVKRVSWREGRALQVMHAGPDESAGETHARLRARAEELGYGIRGRGHEIYLEDPRRAVAGGHRRIMRLSIAWPRPDYARGPGEPA